MDTEEQLRILATRIQAQPGLEKRIEAILDIMENKSGEFITADEAESKCQKVLEEIRCRLPVDWEAKQEAKKAKKKSKRKVEKKEEEMPVEKCYRYISNRQGNLDYKDALDKELPIGSGEIESSHRHVIQKRLEIAGAWWKPEIAEYMLCLRTLRANNDWNRYWHHQLAAA